MNRDTNLDKIKSFDSQWDFVVIGGGASGLGIAVDASKRGYRTLLLEKMTLEKEHLLEVQNLFMEVLDISKMEIFL